MPVMKEYSLLMIGGSYRGRGGGGDRPPEGPLQSAGRQTTHLLCPRNKQVLPCGDSAGLGNPRLSSSSSRQSFSLQPLVWLLGANVNYGVFTPEQDNDKTTTIQRQYNDKTTTRQRQDNDKTTTRQRLDKC